MKNLSQLPNIEKPLEEKLILLGINTPSDLNYLGSKEAYLRLRLIFPNEAPINILYALEGAIRGISWTRLRADIKADLNRFYRLFVKLNV
ncbi:MAG: competence protein TfoX [Bacteroidetes bacterium HGW-Bacteroidetes-17]|jgi:DNA transformation protein|nr:MAG: competence protein TfoX [Bacteroidetes bacterium HGW-Bacteroidetes-17]